METMWAETVDELPGLAAELVRRNVDVIFAPSSTEVEPARQATHTIPIVFISAPTAVVTTGRDLPPAPG